MEHAQFNGTCTITINNSTYTTNYNYEILNLALDQIQCDSETLIICKHGKNLCNSECNLIKNYQLNNAIVIIIIIYIPIYITSFIVGIIYFLHVYRFIEFY